MICVPAWRVMPRQRPAVTVRPATKNVSWMLPDEFFCWRKTDQPSRRRGTSSRGRRGLLLGSQPLSPAARTACGLRQRSVRFTSDARGLPVVVGWELCNRTGSRMLSDGFFNAIDPLCNALAQADRASANRYTKRPSQGVSCVEGAYMAILYDRNKDLGALASGTARRSASRSVRVRRYLR